MAGGKETPRQKLIGLMYLVLLALLALQVSSAIIQKFQFLNSAIQEANQDAIVGSESTVKSIKATVEKSKNSGDLVVLKKAEELRAKTKEVYDYIESTKNELIKFTDGYEEDGSFKGAKEEDKVAQLMVGTAGSKSPANKGNQLKAKINDYVVYLNSLAASKVGKLTISSKKFDKIALDGSEDPVFKKDPDQRAKNFVELNFEHTPMVAAMAVMTELQSRVLSYEGELMGDLSGMVGATQLKFDKVIPMFRAVSSYVAAGTDYEAEMFITATSSSLTPKMSASVGPVKIEGGVGKIKFKAQGGVYKDGVCEKTWTGSITIPSPSGDTTLKLEAKYYVTEPVIDIKSAAVGALYFNCGNPLTVGVPALGAMYNPSFGAEGADVVNGGKKGEIFLVPSNPKKVTLKVSSSGQFIGNKEFPVKPVPKPEIKILSGGKEVDMKNGLKAPGPRNLQVRATPLPDFLETNPKDARYKVAGWTAYLLRGSRLVKQKEASSELLDLSDFTTLAKANDRITIEIKKVTRQNFKDNTEEVKVSNSIYTVPITD